VDIDTAAILKNTAAIMLRVRKVGDRAKVQDDLVPVPDGTTRKSIKAQKVLFACDEFAALCSAQGEIGRWLKERTTQTRYFRGLYLARLSAAEELSRELDAKVSALAPLRDAFRAAYPAAVERARLDLGPLFDPTDYPDAETAANLCGVEYQWLLFSVPEGLPPEVKAAEIQKLADTCTSAAEEITQALAAGLQKIIAHAVERLKTAPGETPKTFHASTLEKFDAFFSTFRDRNLANSQGLAALVERARAVLAGVSPEDIRKGPALRERIASQLETVQADVDAAVIARPARRFDFAE
jgi:hypothetical protein